MSDKPKFRFVDMSAQVFGKYQHCTMNSKDGMFYADSDFDSPLGGKLKKGALPSPWQPTKELTEKAKLMHEASAKKLADTVFKSEIPTTEVPEVPKKKSILDKVYDIFLWRP